MLLFMFLQTSTFMMFGPRKFSFVGSIPEMMLVKVPTDNAIVNEYCKLPTSSVRPMTEELRKILKEGNKLKKGGKQKAKVAPFNVAKTPKKVKKQARKPRYPSPVAQEDSESQTVSEIQENATVQNEVEYTAATLEPVHID